MKTGMKYLAAIWLVLTVVIGYEMMDVAFARGQSDGHLQGFQQGYEQGHTEGQASMVQTQEQVLLQCTQWWFGESNPRAMQAINQYCDRR